VKEHNVNLDDIFKDARPVSKKMGIFIGFYFVILLGLSCYYFIIGEKLQAIVWFFVLMHLGAYCNYDTLKRRQALILLFLIEAKEQRKKEE
jgi:hypothetical protein